MFIGILQADRRLSEADCRAINPGLGRMEIEIGPGNCRYLTGAAVRRPDTLFVGFEMRAATVVSVLRNGPLPMNVRLLRTDGRWVVENILGSNCVDAYHVYFPDPWWKKRHHKRRLLRPRFAQAVAATLKPGACLYLVTDVAATFADARSNLLDAGLRPLEWEPNLAGSACSSYESKYRRQGRRLYQARFLRVEAA